MYRDRSQLYFGGTLFWWWIELFVERSEQTRRLGVCDPSKAPITGQALRSSETQAQFEDRLRKKCNFDRVPLDRVFEGIATALPQLQAALGFCLLLPRVCQHHRLGMIEVDGYLPLVDNFKSSFRPFIAER